MSSLAYLEQAQELIERIRTSQIEEINQAAEKFAQTVRDDKIIYVFGTGHSHMIGIEMFARAGA